MMKYSLRVLTAVLCLGLAVSSPALADVPVREVSLSGEAPLFVPDAASVQQAEPLKNKEQSQKEQTDRREQPSGRISDQQGTAGESDGNHDILVVDEVTQNRPLSEADFTFNGLHAGDSLQKVKRIFGSPTKYAQSAHYTELKYNCKDLDMTIRLRNDTPQILKEATTGRKAVHPGVDSVTLAMGPDVYIGPGIHLGHPAELLVRKYGRPLQVLRDADANVYYFVYENPGRDHVLVFAIGERKVARVALLPPRPPYIEGRPLETIGGWTPRDFTLVGYGVNEPFIANKYNMWTNLVKRSGDKFWLYGTYGVEVDRHNTVKKVFLLTNSSYTGRGATLGYRLSTIFSLYGEPSRIERGPAGENFVDAYYYDSPFQKGVSLVFISKHQTDYVDDVLLISEPIKNIQDPMERYGLK